MNKAIHLKFQQFLGTQYEWESHIDNIFRIFDQNLRTYAQHNILDIGCGDLETDDIPYKDNTLDLVTCNQVLEYLKHYKTTISEAIRVKKNEG